MRSWFRKCWPLAKYLLTFAIVFFVGRQFYRDLNNPEFPNLLRRSLQPGWLALAGALYIAGLGFSAFFWIRLMRRLGQGPDVLPCLRAYYLGHLGKYLPGKAWALFLRASLARSPAVHGGVAGMTALYEVLTTMASGALLGAGLFWAFGHDTATGFNRETLWRLLQGQEIDASLLDRRLMALIALGLFVGIVTPALPGVFNRLARRVALPFLEPGAPPPPRVPWASLVEGLSLTVCGWFLLGASLWAVVRAVSGQPLPFTGDLWGEYTGFLSLAYVLGFVVLFMPSGLGVREYFLTVFLTPSLAGQFGWTEAEAKPIAVMTVLLLRLVWTTAEVIVAGFWSREQLTRLVARGRFPDNGGRGNPTP